MFATITPTQKEIDTPLPGDDIVTMPGGVMDRAFSLPATPTVIWPWFMQLGKHRAGWYFPRWIERFIVPRRRGLRVIKPALQQLHIGDIIDDWGGKNGYLEVVQIVPARTLLYQSTRGQMSMSWSINLHQEGESQTRVHIRLRISGIKFQWFLKTIGEFFDAVTIAGLEAGLRERLYDHK